MVNNKAEVKDISKKGARGRFRQGEIVNNKGEMLKEGEGFTFEPQGKLRV